MARETRVHHSRLKGGQAYGAAWPIERPGVVGLGLLYEIQDPGHMLDQHRALAA